MRSAAGVDTTDKPRVARWWEGRHSSPQGQDDAGSAARPPTPPQLALTCLRQTHRQGSPNARASGGSWEVGCEKRPPPPGRRITGKGRQWVPRKQGGEDREAVHRAALVRSPEPGPISLLPEGPRATLQPTGDLEEPQSVGAARLRPVHLPPLIASLQPGLPPFRGTKADSLAFRRPLPWLSRLVRQMGLPGLEEAPILGAHIPPGRGKSFSISDTCLL